MGPGLLLLVSVIYAGVAGDYGLDGRWGMSLAFAAYALANVGFAMDA